MFPRFCMFLGLWTILSPLVSAQHSLRNSVLHAKESRHVHENLVITDVVVLEGTYYEMGTQYGSLLYDELHAVLDILTSVVPLPILIDEIRPFQQRYALQYSSFLQGVASTANMTFDEVSVLNGMETLAIASRGRLGQCAFVFVPGNKTATGSSIIGRNYDYGYPFDQISRYLAVTVLRANDVRPVAILSMVGQVYCPTCVNDNGLFLELNNGMPSGGFFVDTSRQTMLIRMLESLQGADTLTDLSNQLRASQSDYSLIVNAADSASATSFEFSSTLGMQELTPPVNATFVSTNYFQDPAWGSEIPKPTDPSTWDGITRHDNLMRLVSTSNGLLDVPSMTQLMDVPLPSGGRDDNTIYQMVWDTSNLQLAMKSHLDAAWTFIPLRDFF